MGNNKNFDFSIIMPAYNVEEYLQESVDSIVNQTYDFSKVQIIIVDDGSTDGTPALCDKLAQQYPDNIVAIHQTNGGPSKARNTGLDVAKGKFIGFLDSDDKWSENALQIVTDICKKYPNTNIIAFPVQKFDGGKGAHYLNSKFGKVNTEVNILGADVNALLKCVNANFYSKEIIDDTRFDTDISIAEDIKFNLEIFDKDPKYILSPQSTYFYRIRSNSQPSLLQGSTQNTSYYLDVVNKVYYWMINDCKNKYGYIPKYHQNLLINELFWRLNSQKTKPEFLTESEWNEYKQKIYALTQYLDDWVINEKKTIYVDQKFFFFYHKYGEYPKLSQADNNITLMCNNISIGNISQQRTVLEFMYIKDGYLHVEGVARFVGVKEDDNINLVLMCNDNEVKCQFIDRNTDDRFRLDFPVYRDIGFVADIPLNNNEMQINLAYYINNLHGLRKNFQYGKFASVGKAYKNSYYYNEGYMLTIRGYTLICQPCSKRQMAKKEHALRKELVLKGQKTYALARKLYFLRPKRKQYWLISDRAIKADDNGEAFFQYMRKYKRNKVKCKFVISKNCPDYKRLKKYGKVVDFDSPIFKLHYLLCDKFISSNADEVMIRPIIHYEFARDILAKKHYVFLQHGVTKDDVSTWLNKYSKNIYKIITATKDEYNSFLDKSYYYTKENIVATGFPRYDKLYNNPQKQIVIMPTWRKYLSGKNIHGVWTGVSNIESTEYFQFYDKLLNSDKLLKTAKEYGYTIAFLPHPNTYLFCIDKFTKNNDVKFLDTNTPYRQIFAESDLLVTDYSSVAFDFAYLKKPIIYCQFDKERFFAGEHVFTKGYFEYERDGFGEVCYDLDKTVDTLIEYIKSNCQIKPVYLERIEKTFSYTDKNNCQRVYEAITQKK